MESQILSHQKNLLISYISDLLSNSEPHSIAFAFRILGDDYSNSISFKSFLESLAGDVIYEGYPQVASLGYMIGLQESYRLNYASKFLTGLRRLSSRSEAGLRTLSVDDVAILGLSTGLSTLIDNQTADTDEAQNWLLSIIEATPKTRLWSYRMREVAGDLLDKKGRVRTTVETEDLSTVSLELVLRNKWTSVFEDNTFINEINHQSLLKSLLSINLEVSVEIEKVAVYLKSIDLSLGRSISEILPNYDKSALTNLQKIKLRIDQKADRIAKRKLWLSFLLLLLVNLTLVALIFLYGWENMDKWIYITDVSAIILSYGYYVITLREFNPANLYESLKNKQKQKLYQEFNFDLDSYERLSSIAEGDLRLIEESRVPVDVSSNADLDR